MLFDWLITGQVMPTNPATAVRGPKHVMKTGKTPVLDAKEWRKRMPPAFVRRRIMRQASACSSRSSESAAALWPRAVRNS
jgi:hypothetical protein